MSQALGLTEVTENKGNDQQGLEEVEVGGGLVHSQLHADVYVPVGSRNTLHQQRF